MGIELNNEQIYAIYDLEHWWHRSTKQTFEISGPAGSGKAQPIDTIIPTPNGNKKLGDIKVGDFVFNRYGEPVEVLGVYDQGELDAYEVTLEDGRSTICNDEHLWSYYDSPESSLKTNTLRNIMNDNLFIKKHGYSIPSSKAVEYSEKDFDVDPYVIGSRICDGSLTGEKRIPEEYFYGSINQRWSLIQGLFNTDWSVTVNDRTNITYSSTSLGLIEDIRRILFSLGCYSTYKKNTRVIHGKENICYILHVKVKNDRVKIHSIRNLGYKTQMRCIYVDDPEHLYLTNDYIVTHNTFLIKYFIERLGLTYDNVLFVAFTGKAATQMSRNGLPAKTIHSAIYEYKEKMARDENGHIILKSNGKPKLVSYFQLRDHISKKIKLIVVDEASMVDEKIALDLLSFNIPIIALGDLNQLPPVFGNPFFLKEPDVILRQIMRQAEGDPIIWISQQILAGNDLKYGVYGNSSIIPKRDITDFHFRKSDIILTGTNRLRYNINQYCREEIKCIKKLEYPHIGEKVICRKNNWNQCINENIYLTNGITGFVENIYRDSYNGKTMKMDFRPDFTKKSFKNIEFDYNHMYAIPGQEEEQNKFGYFYDKMEYAYAITIHTSQGGSWPYVMYLHEDFMRDKEDNKRLKYTAVTRASESLIFVM